MRAINSGMPSPVSAEMLTTSLADVGDGSRETTRRERVRFVQNRYHGRLRR